MNKSKYFLLTLLLIGTSTMLFAQGGSQSAVGKFMRSDERSYVVIAVILAIFIGLVLFLIRLDRKISKLEKGE